MIFNRKVEIIFTKEDQYTLDGQSKICNWLYNYLLDKIKNERNDTLLKGRNIRNEVPKIKQEKPFLRSVYSSPLKNAALRLKLSFDHFFKHNRGYPKFKSWKEKWFSLYYDEPNKGYKVLNNKQIQISLGVNKENKRLKILGILKESLHLRDSDQLKNFRLCKEHEKYYGVFCIERVERKVGERNTSFLSIDPNHKNLFVGIDHNGKSIEFEKITMTKYFDTIIDCLKSKRDQCKKHSKRWMRINKALDKVYHKRREQVKSMCYSVSNYIARHYDCVLIGDYTPTITIAKEKCMHRGMLNQTTIGKFRNILQWVMKRSGKTFIKVNEYNTTKACCICGHIEKKGPHIREFTCKLCNSTLNRDINSSINIAKKENYLSGSDYEKWDLTHVTYTAKWDYRKSKILFTGYALA